MLDEINDAQGMDDAVVPEPPAAQSRYLPSSMGLSFLVPSALESIEVIARWGDYRPPRRRIAEHHCMGAQSLVKKKSRFRLQVLLYNPSNTKCRNPADYKSPSYRKPVHIPTANGGLPDNTQAVSVFLVNRRSPASDDQRDKAFAFQVQIEVQSGQPFIPRPNLRGEDSGDADERVADLQYRDACEFAVGHSVSSEAIIEEPDICRDHPYLLDP